MMEKKIDSVVGLDAGARFLAAYSFHYENNSDGNDNKDAFSSSMNAAVSQSRSKHSRILKYDKLHKEDVEACCFKY